MSSRARARAAISAPAIGAGPRAGADPLRARQRSACSRLALIGFPFLASPFHLDLACQVFLAAIGSLSLMLLTGYAGQISLGHAGLLAAGAFTAGILFTKSNAPFWITLPAAAVVGALLGVIFGLPSLRLRGLYLAVSTLALHFIVVYLGGEYETKRGFSTGIVIDPPQLGEPVAHRRRAPGISSCSPPPSLTLLICLNLAAQPHRARLARRSARTRPSPRRSASASPATSCSPS